MIDRDHPNSPYDYEPEPYYDECTALDVEIPDKIVGRYDGYNLPLDYRG